MLTGRGPSRQQAVVHSSCCRSQATLAEVHTFQEASR